MSETWEVAKEEPAGGSWEVAKEEAGGWEIASETPQATLSAPTKSTFGTLIKHPGATLSALGRRFGEVGEDSLKNSSIAGLLAGYGGDAYTRAQFGDDALERMREDQRAARPQGPGSALEFVTDLGAGLTYGLAAPESYAALPAKFLGPVGKAIPGPVGRLLQGWGAPEATKKLGQKVAERAVEGAATNAALDPFLQLGAMGRDQQEGFSGSQTAISAITGGVLPAGFTVGQAAAGRALERAGIKAQERRAERARIDLEERRARETAEAVARPWTAPDLWAALEQQESGGRQTATSNKGARGVAQLMPDTAKQVAEWVGNPALAEKAMENTPEGAAVNRWLGQVYLAQQMREFGQDPALALAAYNAGPGRVKQWLSRFGHPDEVGRARWIEMIPFDETRNYVRTILGNASGGSVVLPEADLALRAEVLKENRAEDAAARKAAKEAKAAAAEAPNAAVAEVVTPGAAPTPEPARALDEAQTQMQDRSAELERELVERPPAARAEDDIAFPGDRPVGTGEIVDDPWDAADRAAGIDVPRNPDDDALDIIRAGKRVEPGEGPSLAEALLKEGGIRDEGGEISAFLGGKGQDRFWKMLRRVNTGKALDDATLWAWERGYIGKPDGERPQIQELLDALADEAAGKKRFAAEDPVRREMADRVDAIQEMLDYLGLDPQRMSNADIRRAMDDFMEAAAREADELEPEPGAFGVRGEPERADMFGTDESQAAKQLAADLEAKIRARREARGAEPMEAGGLFDETRRGEQDLFGLGGAGGKDPAGAIAAARRLRDMNERMASTKKGLRAQPRARAIPAPPDQPLPKVKGVRVIAKTLAKKLELARRQGRIGMRDALGTYNRKTGMIRTKGYHELDVLAHEIGHALEFTKKYPALLAAMKKHAKVLKVLDYAPKLARRYEGFAEWFRWYVTNPTYAQQVAPGFLADFEAALAAEAPKDLAAIREAQQDYQAFLSAPSVAAAREQVMEPPARGLFNTIYRKIQEEGPLGAAKEFADEVYRGVFDSLDPWKRAVRELERIYHRNTGQRLDLTVVEDPFKLLRQMPAVASAGHMDIMYGVHGYHDLEPDTVGLADALKLALGDKFLRWDPGAIRDFGTYLTGRRMIALYDNFAAGKLEQPPDAMSKEFWQQTVADLELQNPQWAEAADIIYDWTDALLMKRYNAGLIDADTFRQVREDHDQYVPLFRDVSDREQTGGARGQASDRAGGLIRLKGSDRAVINPIHSMMQQAYELNAAIARNDALKALDDLGQLAGPDGGQIVERLPAKEIKGTQVDAMAALDKAAGEIGLSPADRQMVRDTLEMLFGDDAVTTVYKSVDMTPRAGENILHVWRDGKKIPLQLPDGKWGRDMIEAFSGATPPMNSLWLDIASIPARTTRAGITTHPTFFVANWFRDQLTAAILTDVGYIPGVDNLRGIANELGQTDLTRRYNLVGGEVGGMNVAAEQRARGERDVQALRTKGRRIRHFASWQGFAKFTEVAETGTRLGIFGKAYEAAKKRGLDDWAAAREASFDARDYMDFDRHGGWPAVRTMIRVIPFFNAALQAFDKVNRAALGGAQHLPAFVVNTLFGGKIPQTYREQQEAALAAKVWLASSAIAVGSLALRASFQDDPEYTELYDYLRNTHWVLPDLNEDGLYVVIPKPYDIAALSNVMERAFEGTTLNDPTAWGRLAEGLRDIWLPPVDAPIAMVPLELARNRDAFGAPIVPDHLLSREPRDQKTEATSQLAVDFTEAVRKATGVELAPAQADYVARSAGGTWARDVLRMFDRRAPIEKGLADAPFTSRFVKRWSQGAVSTKEFFKLAATNEGEYTKATNSFRDLVNDGKFDEATKRLAAMKPAERAYVMAATFEEGVNKQYHPLVRATEAVREYGGLAKDLSEGNVLVPTEAGLQVLELTRHQRRVAVDGLKKMAVAEQRNALIAAGIPGWKESREPLPTLKYQQEIERAAPGVMQALSVRLQQAKVMPPEEMARGWQIMRPYIEKQQDPVQLQRMMGAKYGGGSGAKERILKQVVPVAETK